MRSNFNRLGLSLLSGVALLLAASSVQAAVVLSDNFDSEAADQLNWDGDTVFRSIPQPGSVPGLPSVDLIGVGGAFDFYPGNGSYVDLDGSTGSNISPAGQLDSVAVFPAGSYTLSFLLGGNARGAPAKTTDVILGDFLVSILLASADPLTLYSFSFTTTGGTLSFIERGPSDQQGNILDDVTLSSVPEPTSLGLIGLGLLGLAGMARRRRNWDAKNLATARV